jgi:hypothetical protein
LLPYQNNTYLNLLRKERAHPQEDLCGYAGRGRKLLAARDCLQGKGFRTQTASCLNSPQSRCWLRWSGMDDAAFGWPHLMKNLVDELYPQAETIVLVADNLNNHSKASLYEAFPPEEAKRIADNLEIHYTPKHGSWLNIIEIELSVLSKQCLDRRSRILKP